LLPAGTIVEQSELPPSCGFIDIKKWNKVLELAIFANFETLPEEIEKQPEEWKEWI
jgi:hypothetical protein